MNVSVHVRTCVMILDPPNPTVTYTLISCNEVGRGRERYGKWGEVTLVYIMMKKSLQFIGINITA